MEYLTDEERQRLERNNARLKLKKEIEQQNEEELEQLAEKIDLIKDTLIFPSPTAIAGRVIEQMTGTPPEVLLLNRGVGTMIKRNVGRKGWKRLGRSLFDPKARAQVRNLSGLDLFEEKNNKPNIMLILLLGGGWALLRYALKSRKESIDES